MIQRSSDSIEYPHSASSHICSKERTMGGCRFSQHETIRWIGIGSLKVSPAEERLDLNIVTGVVIAMVLSGAH